MLLWATATSAAAQQAAVPVTGCQPLQSVTTACQEVVTEIEVPGGIEAFTRAIGVPPIAPAWFVAEASRIVTSEPPGNRLAPDSTARRLSHYLNDRPWLRADSQSLRGRPDRVPIPLTVALWSTAILRRPVTADNLLGTILSDERATLMARGLAALDDPTLAALTTRADVLTRLYERDAAVFASFSSRIRVRAGCVEPPGGRDGVVLWEAVVGARVCSPAAFIAALMSSRDGRIAYLYDVIGHLDAARVRFALGLWMDTPAERRARFTALAEVAAGLSPEWRATRAPFVRPVHDLLSLLARVHVAPDGRPAVLPERAFWTRVLTPGARAVTRANDDRPLVDAAWLAERLLDALTVERSDRLDQFAFGQRVFANLSATDADTALFVLERFVRYPMLLLTLERIGVRQPMTYASLIRQADRLAAVERRAQPLALAQFQGAVALVARLIRTRAIDVSTAESLLARLGEIPVGNGEATAAMTTWLATSVAGALPAGPDLQSRLLAALAGGWGVAPRPIIWEGVEYFLDVDDAERRRLAHLWRDERRAPIDDVLARARVAPSRLASELADTLVALVYAAEASSLPDPTRVPAGMSARHDWGLENMFRRQRERLPWTMPRPVAGARMPWRVQGSLLGLDIALALFAPQRVDEPPALPPTLKGNERHVFLVSAATFDSRMIRDADLDAIGVAVAKGRARIERAAVARQDLDAMADEIGLDGARRRALAWINDRQSHRLAEWLSLTELFLLGGGQSAGLVPLSQWTNSLSGCLCRDVVAPRLVPALVGRSQTGVLAAGIPDLQLRVALAVRELGLPASMTGTLLMFAVQEFVDHVQPTDANDWLTLVLSAQRLSRERIEDYVAAAAAREPFAPLVFVSRE
jgi:hypothetical protein